MRTHSLFSPSRLAMLQKCPGWVSKPALEGEAMPSDAQRGIDLHEVVTLAFMQGIQNHDDPIVSYALSQLADIRRAFPHVKWEAETALDTGIPHCIGYCDIAGIDSFDDTAILVEIKTGYGDRPEAEDSIQLKAYALGLLRSVEMVRSCLIECDQRKVTTAEWTRKDILEIHNEIISIIRASLQGGQFRAGQHCDYCSKQFICPEIESAIESIQQIQAVIAEAKTLSPLEVSDRLDCYWEQMALVEKYWGNLKARAISIIEAGGMVENFTIKVSSGVRKWTDEASAIDSLIKAGIDISALMQLQSPAQVEKTLKAAGVKEIKAMLSGLTVAGERKQLLKIAGPSGGRR